MKAELTQGLLKELLHYSHDTGVFTWLHRDERKFNSWNARFSGSTAGSRRTTGHGKTYIVVTMYGKSYLAHRLAWMHQTGGWPEGEIDHENGNGEDNRWLNLRDVNHSENLKNRRLPSNNSSGTVGVMWSNQNNKWKVQIRDDGKQIYLGYFTNKEDAIQARLEASIECSYHENHGQTRPL